MMLAMVLVQFLFLVCLMTTGTCQLVDQGQFFQLDEKKDSGASSEDGTSLLLNEDFFQCRKNEKQCPVVSKDQSGNAQIWRKIDQFREIATGRETAQSSTFGKSESGRAVDGNTDPIYKHGSCASAHNNPKPWWMVDFGKTAVVYSVTITSRSLKREECPPCFDWMQNFDIKVGNVKSHKQNEFCKKHASMKRTPNTLFKCDKLISGRYLYIVNNLKEVLVFCEVEVSGSYL